MYWRSFSKPDNGVGVDVGEEVLLLVLVFVETFSGAPPHDARSKTIITGKTILALMVLLADSLQSFHP
jgi:hypothetical protein